jgi:hypothetical protein
MTDYSQKKIERMAGVVADSFRKEKPTVDEGAVFAMGVAQGVIRAIAESDGDPVEDVFYTWVAALATTMGFSIIDRPDGETLQ